MNHIFVTLLLLLSVCSSSTALKCVQCSSRICTPPVGCKGGIVKDACNCCDVCAKISGETCGGPWQIFGKCGNQLECIEDTNSTQKGICQNVCTLSSMRMCKIYCPNGNVLDEKGCPTCSCYNLPTCKSLKGYEKGLIKAASCPDIKCAIRCAYGLLIDQNGCTKCSCRSLPALCNKQGCCNIPTRFCNKDNSCCIHDSTCFSRPGWN